MHDFVKSLAAILCLGLVAGGALADFRMEDIVGDDHGSGDLMYPNRDDMRPGDLDLVWLDVKNTAEGTWFTAKFRNRVQKPRGRVTLLGQTPLETIVRSDFYTFNIDIYIDTDRVTESGIVDTAPARKVTVDDNVAWERAIILTPRPDVGRSLLDMFVERITGAQALAEKGRLSPANWAEIRAEARRRVEEFVFLPTRVRVQARQVRFFVPRAFLGGPAEEDWAYTVVVTAADVEQLLHGVRPLNSGMPMMVMPVGRGRQYRAFGVPADHDLDQPPVIDVLSLDPDIQGARLSDYNLVTGRLASLPGVVPSGGAARPAQVGTAQGGTDQVVFREPGQGQTGPGGQAESSGIAAPAVSTAGTGSASGEAASSAPGDSGRRSVAGRLKTLNSLKALGLITEQEYRSLRAGILSEI